VITVRGQRKEARLSVRNFYGVLRVIDHDGASDIPSVQLRPANFAAAEGGHVVASNHVPMY